jgi:hypothetical protein
MVAGVLASIEQIVIEGPLTLRCISRFAMEYHHKRYGYEVLPVSVKYPR